MGSGVLGSDVHLLDVVTPGDIRALKEKIDPFVRALNVDAVSCTTLPESTRQEWNKFFAGWVSFYNLPDTFFTDFFGAVEKRDLALSYETQANDWRDVLAKACSAVITLPRLAQQAEVGGSSFGSPLVIGLVAGGGVLVAALLLRR